MTDNDQQTAAAAELRRRAEAIARKRPPIDENLGALSSEEIKKILHELHVHKIQLEMQNEELRRSQAELESARERYFDLYELAPVGYATLDAHGLIQESNLTAATLLGMTCVSLLKQPLTRFIIPEDQDSYYLNRKQSMETLEPCSCELRMARLDGTIFWAHLSITTLARKEGQPVCRVTLCDITEQKLAAEALRESEERYRLLFESSSDALFLLDAESGRIVTANHMASTLYGYSPDELLAMRCIDLAAFPGERCRCITEALEAPGENRHIAEHLHRKKEGTAFPVEITARTMTLNGHQGIYVAVRDLTERQRAEEALRESEHQRLQEQQRANARLKEKAENLASIYQALDSVGMIVCDLQGNDALISNFNPGAEKLFGWRQEEVIGKSISLIYPPEIIRLIPGSVVKLSKGKSIQSFDMTMVRKSGERFSCVISLHPFDSHEGRCRKAVGSIRDISELIHVQTQLKAINTDLEKRVEQRTRELQETQNQYLHVEKLSAIGKLSASIAHEFNNPLQGILSILKGLKKRAILDEEDRELLNAAISESDRIKDLIRNLSDFNRPSTGRKALVDVHKSLDSILLLHKSDFKGKRIKVVLNYDEGLPRIVAVPDQIKQVFLNLLANAADACQVPGGMITISTRQENGQVAVAFEDTGIGIKPEDRDLIFQPFFTTKPAVKGTGLGLSVSYGIVKKHGGNILVESSPGQGATFTVLLPFGSVHETVVEPGR